MEHSLFDAERVMRRASLWQPLLSYALKEKYEKVQEAIQSAVGDELPGISGLENEVSNYEGLPDWFRVESQALREEAEDRIQKIVDTMYDGRIASLKKEKEMNEKLLRTYEDREAEGDFAYLLGQETRTDEELPAYISDDVEQVSKPLNPEIDEKVPELYNKVGICIEEIEDRITALEEVKQRTIGMLKTEGETAEQYRKNIDLANTYDLLACAIVRFEKTQDKPIISFGEF